MYSCIYNVLCVLLYVHSCIYLYTCLCSSHLNSTLYFLFLLLFRADKSFDKTGALHHQLEHYQQVGWLALWPVSPLQTLPRPVFPPTPPLHVSGCLPVLFTNMAPASPFGALILFAIHRFGRPMW